MRDVALYRVKIFADGADRASILDLAANPLIKGFTTNPTLMRKAGIADYEAFGRSLAREIPNRPFSFEVLSDDFDQMEQQALEIATWGGNVYVKIPITDTRGRSSAALVKRLARQGVKLNVTALMTLEQVAAGRGRRRSGPALGGRRGHRRGRGRRGARLARGHRGLRGRQGARPAAPPAARPSSRARPPSATGMVRFTAPSVVFENGRRAASRPAASSRSRPTTCAIANLDPTLERAPAAGRARAELLARFPDGLCTQEVAVLLAGNLVEVDRAGAEDALLDARRRGPARRASRSATTRSLARGLSARPIRMTTPPRTPR